MWSTPIQELKQTLSLLYWSEYLHHVWEWKCHFGIISRILVCQSKCVSTVSVCILYPLFSLQEVKLGESVSLKAFPYAESDSTSGFTYKWYQNGSYKGDQAELKVDKVTQNSCSGYYSCKIMKDGEHSFSVYHCLRVTGKLQLHVYRLINLYPS